MERQFFFGQCSSLQNIMKGSILALVALLAIAVSTGQAFRCPSSLGTYSSYPGTYYICINYVPFKQLCPPQTFFDERYKQCKLDITYVVRPEYITTPRWNFIT